MNIQLKQNEIEAALKGYVTQQGINLAGKQVNIAFTAGRKESGISAELVIEDSELPDFSGDVAQDRAAIIIPINRVDVSADAQESVSQEKYQNAATTVVEGGEVLAEPVKTNSLFG